MEYTRLCNTVPVEVFKPLRNTKLPVHIVVQFVPAGTATPKDDGSTSYTLADSAILTLYTGKELLSPIVQVDLSKERK